MRGQNASKTSRASLSPGIYPSMRFLCYRCSRAPVNTGRSHLRSSRPIDKNTPPVHSRADVKSILYLLSICTYTPHHPRRRRYGRWGKALKYSSDSSAGRRRRLIRTYMYFAPYRVAKNVWCSSWKLKMWNHDVDLHVYTADWNFYESDAGVGKSHARLEKCGTSFPLEWFPSSAFLVANFSAGNVAMILAKFIGRVINWRRLFGSGWVELHAAVCDECAANKYNKFRSEWSAVVYRSGS